MRRYTWKKALTLTVFAITLVFTLFNPIGYSLFHWGKKLYVSGWPNQQEVILFSILSLSVLGFLYYYIKRTIRGMGKIGLVLGTTIYILVAWFAFSAFSISLTLRAITYAVQIGVSILLGAGMNSAHLDLLVSGVRSTEHGDDDNN